MRILYLDLDTLRPDHLGCYGYHRNTSPNIDSIARRGVRFENFYATDAPCLPSRSALMSGRFGIHNGVVGHGGTAADLRMDGPSRGFRSSLDQDSLWAFIQHQGFYTTYVGGFGERHSTWTYYAGFREIHDTGKGGMESAEDVTPTALDWIERKGDDDNWYLHVNYWDPHTPYRAPKGFGNPFADDPLPEWLTEDVVREHWNAVGPHTAQEVSMYSAQTDPKFPRHPGAVSDMESARMVIDGYDCGIKYMDGHIGQILQALERKGVLDDTAIIVSSDHGENLGELGIYAEHATADNITCRIPFIMSWPGSQQDAVDTGLHYNIDVAPTMAELFDAEPRPAWDGESFAPAVLSGDDNGRDHLVISQCAHVCQRSVRWDNWLYMRTYHDGYHLWPNEMLYDVDADPHLQNDLAADNPETVATGRETLADWHAEMMRTMPDGYDNDPMDTVLAEGGPYHANGQLPKYIERLKDTGRGHAVEELRRRHPGEFNR